MFTALQELNMHKEERIYLFYLCVHIVGRPEYAQENLEHLLNVIQCSHAS